MSGFVFTLYFVSHFSITYWNWNKHFVEYLHFKLTWLPCLHTHSHAQIQNKVFCCLVNGVPDKRNNILCKCPKMAVHMVQDLGQGCLLGKSEVKSAFRLLPVAPQDFDQLGFQFENLFYFDKAMLFGCSKSCNTWEKFARFLEFAVKRHSNRGDLLHYLDDFLFGGQGNTDQCQHIMGIFKLTLQSIGVPIAVEKTEGPTTVLCFLGLELDSDTMVVRIPFAKVSEITERINTILSQEKVTLKAMQSLIGVLNFACRAIVPGRPFCRRLINSICGLTKPYHHLRITSGMRQDLQMWLSFFQEFNGISVFHDRFWVSNEDVHLFTDSAAGQGMGFGIYFAGKWAYAPWPMSWFDLGITDDITVLELFPLLVALTIWGEELRNKKICFRCDNEAVVQIVNTMTSKSVRVMVLLRAFTLLCLKLNVVVRSSHVSGVSNVLADSLSRLQTSIPNTPTKPRTSGTNTCNFFNQGYCSYNPCRFPHVCSHCGRTNHGRINCFQLKDNASAGGTNSSFRKFRGSRPFNRGGRNFANRGNRQ